MSDEPLSAETTQPRGSNDHEVALRLAGEFFIRGVEILAKSHGGDLVKGIIFTAIAVANAEGASAGAGPLERRPVSVMSISSSIGVPYETTRRYVNLLVHQGMCVRLGRRGVLATESALFKPEMLVAHQETYTSFNRLVAALRRARYAGLTPT